MTADDDLVDPIGDGAEVEEPPQQGEDQDEGFDPEPDDEEGE